MGSVEGEAVAAQGMRIPGVRSPCLEQDGKERMPSTPRLLIATAAGLLLCAGQASATLITLSDFASNGVGAPTADVLDATMDFDVDVILNTLTLTVSNTTVAPDEFQINRIYFNAGGNVTDLLLNSFPTGWDFKTGPEVHANGFGLFDFALGAGNINGTGNSLILPGQSIVFVFDIVKSGPILKADFINTFSLNPPGMTDDPMTHAAKFVRGPGDISGFGAVPAPGTLVLLGIAGALLSGRRRRR